MKRRLVAVVQAFSAADVCSVSFPGVDSYRVLCIVVPVLRDVGGTSTQYLWNLVEQGSDSYCLTRSCNVVERWNVNGVVEQRLFSL
jgi:hypothetical protein